MAGLRHPAGNGAKLTAAIAANYNAYVSSGIMTNADRERRTATLAPFEIGTGDYTVAEGLTRVDRAARRTGPPSTTDNVSCLSCHRAHASGFESMPATSSRTSS